MQASEPTDKGIDGLPQQVPLVAESGNFPHLIAPRPDHHNKILKRKRSSFLSSPFQTEHVTEPDLVSDTDSTDSDVAEHLRVYLESPRRVDALPNSSSVTEQVKMGDESAEKDAIIQVESEEIEIHKKIVCAQSVTLAKVFIDQGSHKYVLPPDIQSAAVEKVIKYMYERNVCELIDYCHNDVKYLLAIWKVAVHLQMEELASIFELSIKMSMKNYPPHSLVIGIEAESLKDTKLFSFCVQLLETQTSCIVTSNEWVRQSPLTIHNIVMHTPLHIKEITLYIATIDWAANRTQTKFNEHHENYAKQARDILSRSKILFHIRFMLITLQELLSLSKKHNILTPHQIISITKAHVFHDTNLLPKQFTKLVEPRY